MKKSGDWRLQFRVESADCQSICDVRLNKDQTTDHKLLLCAVAFLHSGHCGAFLESGFKFIYLILPTQCKNLLYK